MSTKQCPAEHFSVQDHCYNNLKSISICFQIYTMAGRRAQPSMMLGSAAVFMDCDENWKLMVVTRNGSLHLWELQESKRLLHESLGPLLNSTSANSMLSSNGKELLPSSFALAINLRLPKDDLCCISKVTICV